MGSTGFRRELPRFVLFGDSLTEWSFDSETEGFGWHLTNLYKDKAEIVNKGINSCSLPLYNLPPPCTSTEHIEQKGFRLSRKAETTIIPCVKKGVQVCIEQKGLADSCGQALPDTHPSM